MSNKPVYVTRPDLPPLAEFLPLLEQIWESRWLTNAGPFHQQFEVALAAHLGVEHLSLLSNGTLALMVALQALEIGGEVITTPYSFVATAHALLWNNLTPVFVDIDPSTGNLDPDKIAAAITPRTSAILPVHCYGTPCDTARIQTIAHRHGLKVIYDAAHAFDVRQDGRTILDAGDLSILSFHATKVFNTFEGGAIISPDAKTKQRVDFLKNFGFADEVTVMAAGINAKMNEFQAALGLVQLNHVGRAIAARGRIAQAYRTGLEKVPGIGLLPLAANVEANDSYFPILVQPGHPMTRDGLYERLKGKNIFARRYFHPLISNMPMYRHLPSAARENLPAANRMADQVLCLPIYPGLEKDQLAAVIDTVAGAA